MSNSGWVITRYVVVALSVEVMLGGAMEMKRICSGAGWSYGDEKDGLWGWWSVMERERMCSGAGWSYGDEEDVLWGWLELWR